jgi:hypothetical protein
MTHATDRDRRRPMDEGSAFGLHSADSGTHVRAAGASIVQVGISEKALFFLVLAVLVVALVISIIALDKATQAAATATAEVAALRDTVRTNNAKIEVIQYDHHAVKSQLVAKGIYQATEH